MYKQRRDKGYCITRDLDSDYLLTRGQANENRMERVNDRRDITACLCNSTSLSVLYGIKRLLNSDKGKGRDKVGPTVRI